MSFDGSISGTAAIIKQRVCAYWRTPFVVCSHEINFIFFLTTGVLRGNMKLASQEVYFMFLREAAMKTKVKELRTAAKMTQQQLADLVLVSSRTIISIEKEQYSPSLMLAYRMAQVFGVSVEDLCCLQENKELEDKQYENLV